MCLIRSPSSVPAGISTLSGRNFVKKATGLPQWLQQERSEGVPLLVLLSTKVLIGVVSVVYMRAYCQSANQRLASATSAVHTLRGKLQLCTNALPEFFLHDGQWQRSLEVGAELKVNWIAWQRQEPVIGSCPKFLLDDGVDIPEKVGFRGGGDLGMKRPRAIMES